MLSFFHKRRRHVIWSAALGAAGAAAAYYWWSYSDGQARSTDHEPSEVNILDLVRATTPTAIYGQHCLREANAREKQRQQQQHEECDEEEEQSLDESMDCHFSYIQEVSAPQELEQLLPQLKAVLYQMTDISQLRTAQHQQPTASSSGSNSSAQLQPASMRLKSLARLSFSRTLGACWLIPLMDLYVRVKLNVIGRHLFLQEKLGQLNPGATATGYGPNGQLPPRLSPMAIEAFLRCDYFAESGCKWVVSKVMEGVDAVLAGTSVEAEVSPQQLLQTMASMLSATDLSMRGDSGVEPIPWGEVLAGPLELASNCIDVQHAAASGAESYRRAMSSASMVEELHVELRSMLSNYRFAEAVRSAVQHTFRAAAAQVYAGIPAGEQGQAQQQQQSSPGSVSGQGVAQAVASSPGATSTSGGTGSMHPQGSPSFRTPEAPTPSPFAQADPAASGGSKSPGATGVQRQQQPGDVSLHRDLSAVWGAVPSTPPVGPTGISSKPARPMARLLKAVQSASDPVFGNIRQITRGIAGLPPVMGLCATAFACSAAV